MTPEPGRLLRALASLLVRGEAAPFVLGDLEEAMERELAGGMSPWRVYGRYLLNALGSGSRLFAEALRRGPGPLGASLLDGLRRDFDAVVRLLRRAPGFSVTIVAILGVGMGVATAIGTLVLAVVARPLPYPEQDRLVSVGHVASNAELTWTGLSPGMFVHYTDGNRVFDAIGTYTEADVGTITGPGEPEQVRTAMVTSGLFDVLGIRPIHGRLPLPEDFEVGVRNGVVISHDLWTRRFGADPNVVGRPLSIARMWDITIVGVLGADVDFPRPDTDIWIGLSHERFLAELGDRAALGGLLYGGVARLRPGVSIEDAQQDLRRLIALVPERFPDVTPQRLSELGLMPVVRPLKDELIGETSALVFLLIGGIVLLFVAWANVGTLSLARAERLHEEVAVARAIGATQWHLARRFCVEALALSGAAGLLAYVLARTAIDLRFGFELGSIPRLHEVTVDGGVVAGLLSLTAASATTLALITYARVRYATAGSTLHLTMGRSSPGRRAHTSRRALVAAQVAMAVPLVVGSALMAESYWRLSRVELGFDGRNGLTFALAVPPDAFRTSGDYYRDVAEVHDVVRRRLLDLPGVRAVESATRLPLSTDAIYYGDLRLLPDVGAPTPREPSTAFFSLATPGYFGAMAIPLLRGRTFVAEDTDGSTPGAVLSASLARALFGVEDPVGRQIRWPGNSRYPPLTVVGIVGDVPAISIAEGPSAMLYLPNIYPPVAPQMMDVSIYIPDSQSYVVHATTPAAVLMPEVRRIVQEVDPTLFVREPGSMAQHVGRSTARTRLTLWLLAVGSGTALFLGMVGLYAVLSHAVGRRRTEFGIRMVVGAEARDLTRGVVAEGLITALAGIAFGLIIARGTSELLRGLIYGVSPGSPETFIAVSLVLLGAAAGASYVPARRAARLDPVAVLRAE